MKPRPGSPMSPETETLESLAMGESEQQAMPADATVDLFCPFCGYNLRGIDSQRCPECGNVVDRSELLVCRIPWVHRKSIGRVKAYLQTVRMVISHPVRFGREAARPVPYGDARLFRWVTVGIAALTLALAVMLPKWSQKIPATIPLIERPSEFLDSVPRQLRPGYGDNQIIGDLMTLFVAGMSFTVQVLSLVVILYVASKLVSLFCRPSGSAVILQNRAVAVTNYACAALALVPVGFACMLLLVATSGLQQRTGGLLLSEEVIGVGLVLVLSLLWWIGSAIMLKSATRGTMLRVAAYLCLWPLAVALLRAMALTAIPCVVGFVKLAVITLLWG
jgi:hypothetical protein